MFGPINVHYDAWSEYVEPTVYALRDQQRIVHWTDVRGLTFSGDGLQYMRCLRLYHTLGNLVKKSNKNQQNQQKRRLFFVDFH